MSIIKGLELFIEAEPSDMLGPTLPPVAELPIYSTQDFYRATGRMPKDDDMGRFNCPDAGLSGHLTCGVCPIHRMPRCECGCVAPYGGPDATLPGRILPLIRIGVDAVDSSRVVMEHERILGWPGLDAFEGFVQRSCNFIGMRTGEDTEEQMREVVQQLFLELIQRGALYRDEMREGAWRYNGCGR